MNYIHDAGKVFPLFCSFYMDRRLDTATGKIKVHIKALLESNGRFLLKPSNFGQIYLPLPTFPLPTSPLTTLPLPKFPLPTSSPFSNLSHLCWLSSSFAGLFLLWLLVLPLPTSPTPCRLYLLLPTSLTINNLTLFSTHQWYALDWE